MEYERWGEGGGPPLETQVHCPLRARVERAAWVCLGKRERPRHPRCPVSVQPGSPSFSAHPPVTRQTRPGPAASGLDGSSLTEMPQELQTHEAPSSPGSFLILGQASFTPTCRPPASRDKEILRSSKRGNYLSRRLAGNKSAKEGSFLFIFAISFHTKAIET